MRRCDEHEVLTVVLLVTGGASTRGDEEREVGQLIGLAASRAQATTRHSFAQLCKLRQSMNSTLPPITGPSSARRASASDINRLTHQQRPATSLQRRPTASSILRPPPSHEGSVSVVRAVGRRSHYAYDASSSRLSVSVSLPMMLSEFNDDMKEGFKEAIARAADKSSCGVTIDRVIGITSQDSDSVSGSFDAQQDACTSQYRPGTAYGTFGRSQTSSAVSLNPHKTWVDRLNARVQENHVCGACSTMVLCLQEQLLCLQEQFNVKEEEFKHKVEELRRETHEKQQIQVQLRRETHEKQQIQEQLLRLREHAGERMHDHEMQLEHHREQLKERQDQLQKLLKRAEELKDRELLEIFGLLQQEQQEEEEEWKEEEKELKEDLKIIDEDDQKLLNALTLSEHNAAIRIQRQIRSGKLSRSKTHVAASVPSPQVATTKKKSIKFEAGSSGPQPCHHPEQTHQQTENDAHEQRKEVRETNKNFREFREQAGWGFEGIFGDTETDFHDGLHKFNGRYTREREWGERARATETEAKTGSSARARVLSLPF